MKTQISSPETGSSSGTSHLSRDEGNLDIYDVDNNGTVDNLVHDRDLEKNVGSSTAKKPSTAAAPDVSVPPLNLNVGPG